MKGKDIDTNKQFGWMVVAGLFFLFIIVFASALYKLTRTIRALESHVDYLAGDVGDCRTRLDALDDIDPMRRDIAQLKKEIAELRWRVEVNHLYPRF